MDSIEISYKTFVDYYRGILTSSGNIQRVWFFKEDEKKFTLLIPENNNNIIVSITKREIYDISEDKEKLEYDEVIQKWKEENLINAIPYENIIKGG